MFALQLGLLIFVVVHNYTSASAALDSDFAPSWLGGSTWRTVGPSHAYDVSAQAALFAHITSGQGHGVVGPYAWAPGSLLLAIPLSLISLRGAYDVWLLVQLVALAAAALIAVVAAASRSSWTLRGAAAAAAAVSAGAVATALFGQWDGIPALGVGLAYALWKRGHEGWAAAVLTVLMLSGKPHLALGLVAFTVGRGSRRGLLGLVCGLIVTGAVDLALVQVTGMRGWVDTLGQISTLSATGSLSVFGLLADTLGGASAVAALAVVAAVALVVSGAAFGWLSRRSPRLDVCLLGATCVSLLASPHLFAQDLALLIPLAAAYLALVIAQARHDLFVLGLAAVSVVSLAAEYQIFPLGALRADPIVPVLLLLTAAWAWRAAAIRLPAGTAHDRGLVRQA
jgi:Glycosyltransferase family 87